MDKLEKSSTIIYWDKKNHWSYVEVRNKLWKIWFMYVMKLMMKKLDINMKWMNICKKVVWRNLEDKGVWWQNFKSLYTEIRMDIVPTNVQHKCKWFLVRKDLFVPTINMHEWLSSFNYDFSKSSSHSLFTAHGGQYGHSTPSYPTPSHRTETWTRHLSPWDMSTPPLDHIKGTYIWEFDFAL